MARTPSKILTAPELAAMRKTLRTENKQHADNEKAAKKALVVAESNHGKALKAAQKSFDDAKKSADKALADAKKSTDKTVKEAGKGQESTAKQLAALEPKVPAGAAAGQPA